MRTLVQIHVFIITIYVCVCVHAVCHSMYIKSEDNLHELGSVSNYGF